MVLVFNGKYIPISLKKNIFIEKEEDKNKKINFKFSNRSRNKNETLVENKLGNDYINKEYIYNLIISSMKHDFKLLHNNLLSKREKHKSDKEINFSSSTCSNSSFFSSPLLNEEKEDNSKYEDKITSRETFYFIQHAEKDVAEINPSNAVCVLEGEYAYTITTNHGQSDNTNNNSNIDYIKEINKETNNNYIDKRECKRRNRVIELGSEDATSCICVLLRINLLDLKRKKFEINEKIDAWMRENSNNNNVDNDNNEFISICVHLDGRDNQNICALLFSIFHQKENNLNFYFDCLNKCNNETLETLSKLDYVSSNLDDNVKIMNRIRVETFMLGGICYSENKNISRSHLINLLNNLHFCNHFDFFLRICCVDIFNTLYVHISEINFFKNIFNLIENFKKNKSEESDIDNSSYCNNDEIINNQKLTESQQSVQHKNKRESNAYNFHNLTTDNSDKDIFEFNKNDKKYIYVTSYNYQKECAYLKIYELSTKLNMYVPRMRVRGISMNSHTGCVKPAVFNKHCFPFYEFHSIIAGYSLNFPFQSFYQPFYDEIEYEICQDMYKLQFNDFTYVLNRHPIYLLHCFSTTPLSEEEDFIHRIRSKILFKIKYKTFNKFLQNSKRIRFLLRARKDEEGQDNEKDCKSDYWIMQRIK